MELTKELMLTRLDELKPFLKEAAAELNVTVDTFKERSMEVYQLAVEKYKEYMMDIALQRTPKGKALYQYVSESVWRKFNPGQNHKCSACGCDVHDTMLCNPCDERIWKRKSA